MKKYVLHGGGRGSLKREWKWTWGSWGGGWGVGGGQAYLYVCLVEKIAWFFKQQTEFFLICCLAVAKSFCCFEPSPAHKGVFLLKRHRHFFKCFFMNLWMFLSFYIYVYNCKKIDHLYCWSLLKKWGGGYM